MKKIAIASDHAGFKLKEVLKKYLESKGYNNIQELNHVAIIVSDMQRSLNFYHKIILCLTFFLI